ncbi:MAG: DUF502 domain-containing protein [Thermoplasmatota archaeon]
MNRFKKFLWTTLIGGLGVILPLAIIAWVFYWIYSLILDLVSPISEPLGHYIGVSISLAGILTVIIILTASFLLGMALKTELGYLFHSRLEGKFLKKIPGYTVTKEVILHFSGEEEVPFSAVAMCSPFGDGNVLMTGFITDRHAVNGYVTVFVPTGPNPTSGNIYHLPVDKVVEIEASVERGIKSVVGCGAGTKPLMQDYHAKLHGS